MSNFAPASDDLSTRLTWEQVEAIVDSSPCISTFAACEWSELSEDGKLWTVVFANEVLRRHSPTEPSRRETVGVTEEMIEAAARSDAAFDGRPIETLGRVERDRYRARAHRALNAALARTSPEVRGAEDVSDTGIERIDVPGGWYFQQVNEGGVVYALRTPSGKGFGIHGGGMSTYKTTVQAFVSSIESALSSPEHDDEVWELLQRAERAVAGKAANLKPWADKIPGRVNHWAVLRDEIYAAIRKENARRRAHVTPEAALASPPAQTSIADTYDEWMHGNGWAKKFAPPATGELDDMLGRRHCWTKASGSDLDTNDGFVRTVYRNLLGREPEETSPLPWVAMLASGLSRERVVQGIIGSDEFRDRYRLDGPSWARRRAP